MSNIDEKTLQSYYDSRNYAAAAEYLRTAVAKDYRSQQQLNAHIRQLERDAAIQQSTYAGLDEDQKEAYSFMQSMNGNGVIPRNRTIKINGVDTQETNSYGTNYLNYINSLKGNDGKALDRIAVTINSDDDLNLLASSLDCDNINSNKLGISYQPLGNGKHRVIISRDNKNLYKLLSTVNDLSSKSALSIAGGIAEKTVYGTSAGIGIGAMFAGVGALPGAMIGAGTGFVTGIGSEIYDAIANSNRFDIYGISPDGTIYNTDNFNYDSLKNLKNRLKKIIKSSLKATLILPFFKNTTATKNH